MDSPSGPRRRSRRSVLLEVAATVILATAGIAVGVWRRTGDTGFVRIADDQVAVVVDRARDVRRTVQRPGYVPFVPLLQKVHLFDRSPRVLRMQGSRAEGTDRVPQLLARAKDGSSFWFKEVEVQYALTPGAAPAVLDDAGADSFVKPELVRAAARAILRDELGRFTAEEVARGECLQLVARAAQAGLADVLRPHGVEVLGVSLGKPSFDDEYEEAIRRRMSFTQEVAELDVEFRRQETDGERRGAKLEKEKEVELRKLEGTLLRDLGATRRDEIRVRQEADDAASALVEAGRSIQLEKQQEAALLKAKYVGAARSVYREGLELERAGDLPVRAALVRKLAGIQFDFAPYSRDAAPHRVEYENLPGPPGPKGKP